MVIPKLCREQTKLEEQQPKMINQVVNLFLPASLDLVFLLEQVDSFAESHYLITDGAKAGF